MSNEEVVNIVFKYYDIIIKILKALFYILKQSYYFLSKSDVQGAVDAIINEAYSRWVKADLSVDDIILLKNIYKQISFENQLCNSISSMKYIIITYKISYQIY